MLERVNYPIDLKQLVQSELEELASDIRKVLLKKMSICGGHFGSNFGIVEATIALHYVFDSPRDKFIFDVSHQSYTHKILTGRKDAFIKEEHYRDVSGYTSPKESKHDHFSVGHTATSISLACGMAKARDLAKRNENVIAIIGDGSLSGGEAYEGLNYASELKSNLIVLVNDNGMSIADNHGGIYSNLKKLRETNGKYECNFFVSLGFDYFYVQNGNNIHDLIECFNKVKNYNKPVVVHICTEKGCGYLPALNNKEMWHWRPPFKIETGEMCRPISNEETYDTILRDYLLKKIEKDSSVVAMVAAVPLSIRFTKTERNMAGKQFVDVGIAEEHAITMAAAIAKTGGKPIFTTDCTFYQRAYDQIAQELCINSCPATLLVRNASVAAMTDVTHLGIFDIPMLSNIPNFIYLAPTTKQEYIQMLEWSIQQTQYPVGIRIPKGTVVSDEKSIDPLFGDINRFKMRKKGTDIAIIAVGNMYQTGETIISLLKKQYGIEGTLINPRFLSGIDEEMLSMIKQDHNLVITLEDGILDGGFGEKISRFYGCSSVKVKCYGLKKEFMDRYVPEQVITLNRMKAELIVEDIMQYYKGRID